MKKPIVAPMTMPIASMRSITTHGSHSPRSSAAEATVVSAMTPPTDRSIPPDRITKVMPIALIRRNGLARKRLRNTCGSRIPS